MTTRILQFSALVLIVSVWMGACSGRSLPTEPTAAAAQTYPPTPDQAASPTPDQEDVPTARPDPTGSTPSLPASCSLGLGLRRETAELLIKYKEHPGLVMAGSSNMAEIYFPELPDWTRVIGAPSLGTLQIKADRADRNDTPYEVLGYGLETSATTPAEEWQNLELSTERAKNIADQHDKQLLMGPGYRLMSENEELYAPMASQADIWVIQTQRLQVNPPGEAYRDEVSQVIEKIKSGNPEISIWAQITLPPDQEPDAEQWLAYRQSIVDLVDGTYIGIYTWDSEDPDELLKTIDTIFTAACGEKN